MSTAFLNGLPQSGWIREDRLAESLDLHSKTLRRWLQKLDKGVAKNVAGVVLVHLERFYDALPDLETTEPDETDGEEKKTKRTRT
jgi:hypothetical protein